MRELAVGVHDLEAGVARRFAVTLPSEHLRYVMLTRPEPSRFGGRPGQWFCSCGAAQPCEHMKAVLDLIAQQTPRPAA